MNYEYYIFTYMKLLHRIIYWKNYKKVKPSCHSVSTNNVKTIKLSKTSTLYLYNSEEEKNGDLERYDPNKYITRYPDESDESLRKRINKAIPITMDTNGKLK